MEETERSITERRRLRGKSLTTVVAEGIYRRIDGSVTAAFGSFLDCVGVLNEPRVDPLLKRFRVQAGRV